MKVNGVHYRTIWLKHNDPKVVQTIDQRWLPHRFVVEDLKTFDDVIRAIKEMHVRGAGLIGAAAGYGMYIAALEAPEGSFDSYVLYTGERLKDARPTAVNLAWAVERQLMAIKSKTSTKDKIRIALETANKIADEDVQFCRKIGEYGSDMIKKISREKGGETVNILTHCNAGWLAFVDYGSALAPIYMAHDRGIKVHVWVDETRPWNQGARLTAWELGQHGVPHTVIADNAGGHLMQHGMIDIVIVGADRVTRAGDVANKIGTYLKAVAAKDNRIPFYVALPSSTFDWNLTDGIREIPIEERGSDEVKYALGLHEGEIKRILVAPKDSPAKNFVFDVTPSRLITGLITERGICEASEEGIMELYPERQKSRS